MYTLTLTKQERQAFDWVGHRYSAGPIADILRRNLTDKDWNDEEPITFNLSESDAWWIRTLAEEEEFCWPCFEAALTQKLTNFVDQIV